MFTSHFLKHVKPICRPHLGLANRRWLSDGRRPHDPLKILFCGADEFSIYSLRAVESLKKRKPGCVASIDVVCRPDKRVGRGLKKIQEVPIKGVAKELELPIYQIDTFTGWSPPSHVDLVIAVSFGLLVPSRILKSATYGGLNVHPSMLPDLRGPAPVQHALLKSRTHTGVSLQTMHPSRFDHGMILAQTSPPGIEIPDDCTPDDLIHKLGPLGAEMLVEGIEHGLFASPIPAVTESDPSNEREHAPKILPEDRHIDWTTWTADRILRYDRVLGKLWDTTTYQQCFAHRGQASKRVTFHGPWRQTPEGQSQQLASSSLSAGKPVLYRAEDSRQPLFALRTVDGQLLSPASATIEGEQKGKGLSSLIPALRTSSKL